MQSTDPGGVFPVHPTSTTPNVTSPTSNQNHNNNSSSSGNGGGGGTGAHTPPIRSKNTWGRFQTWMDQWRGSRQLVLIIVAIALLLDNMLLTVVGKLLGQYNHPLFHHIVVFLNLELGKYVAQSKGCDSGGERGKSLKELGRRKSIQLPFHLAKKSVLTFQLSPIFSSSLSRYLFVIFLSDRQYVLVN